MKTSRRRTDKISKGTFGLDFFLNIVLSCHGTSAEAICAWYVIFCTIVSNTGFYLHPYYYSCKNVPSNNRFTCGFITAAVAFIHGVPEVLYCAAIPSIAIAAHVPENFYTDTAEVIAVTSSPYIPKVLAVPKVPPVAAQPYQQHDIPGIFQKVYSNHNMKARCMYNLYFINLKLNIFWAIIH